MRVQVTDRLGEDILLGKLEAGEALRETPWACPRFLVHRKS